MTDDEDESLNPDDLARWESARTLADLGGLTAQWLEGKIAYVPGYGGAAPDEETEPFVPVLAAANRAGYVTIVSQPGEEPTVGYDGELWTQRAAVEGYAATGTLEALRSCAAGTRLILTASPVDRPDSAWETQIVVTRDGGRENTWFGSLGPRDEVEDPETGYGMCHPDAVGALLAAWQVTIIDPEWGRNDVLWPVLRAFADSAVHMTKAPGQPST